MQNTCQLRDYQQTAVDFAADFLRTAEAGKRLLLAAPTGTGKSYIELALQDAIPGSWIISPKIEIVAGLLQKRGYASADASDEAKVINTAAKNGIYTPIRLRNLLLAGELKAPPALILDEAHHDSAESWQDLHLLLGYPPAVGFTASPFRGTPKSTAEFREEWGLPVWVLTLPEAVERGVLSFPTCSTVPLVDDDLISVANGELVAKEVNESVASRLEDAAKLAPVEGGRPTSPTMFAVPSVELTESLRLQLKAQGKPAVVVTGKTPYSERQTAFRACVNCGVILIQVAVVSEGVDLPIRRLIDLSPTLSPVKWLQQFGRITRPGGESHYICANRNLIRHGYLLDGCLPSSAMAQAQSVFPPSSRSLGLRAVGLEALGRLKPDLIPLRNGSKALIYAVSSMAGHHRTEYAVLVHPRKEELIWARKHKTLNRETGGFDYGRWERCDAPEDMIGFASKQKLELSEAQQRVYKREAKRYGLDSEVEIDRKQIQAFFVLRDLRLRNWGD